MWTKAETKPTGLERRVFAWVEFPDAGERPTEYTKAGPKIVWWRQGPECFAFDEFENANHLVKFWMDIPAKPIA